MGPKECVIQNSILFFEFKVSCCSMMQNAIRLLVLVFTTLSVYFVVKTSVEKKKYAPVFKRAFHKIKQNKKHEREHHNVAPLNCVENEEKNNPVKPIQSQVIMFFVIIDVILKENALIYNCIPSLKSIIFGKGFVRTNF